MDNLNKSQFGKKTKNKIKEKTKAVHGMTSFRLL